MIEINPIEYTPYEHKYLTLYDNRQDWQDDKDRFEEVNISAIKVDDVAEIYHPSVRHNVWDDYQYEMLAYPHDEEERTLFLEILWGYFGWEWVDYEYIPEDAELDDDNNPIPITLTGGNLYKIRELTEVPSIPDGYRLQHINNFLRSQDRINKVNWFDVSNILSARYAFARENMLGQPLELLINEFPKITDGDYLFHWQDLKVEEGQYINFPNLKTAYSMFGFGTVSDETNIRLRFDKLTSLKSFYKGLHINTAHFNITNTIHPNTLRNIQDFSFILCNCFIMNWEEIDNVRNVYIDLDLRGNTNDLINLNYAFANYRTSESISSKVKINFNFQFDKPVDLSNAFYYTCSNGESYWSVPTLDGTTVDLVNNSKITVKKINLSFTEAQKNLINNVNACFELCEFYEDTPAPITAWNGHSEENYIYTRCVFHYDFTYNFSPNNILNPNSSQFNYAKFIENVNLQNIKYLKCVRFTGTDFGNNIFDFDICDTNIDYGYGGDDEIAEYKGYKDVHFNECKLTRIKNQNIYLACGNDDINGIKGNDFQGGNKHFSESTIDFPSTSENNAIHIYCKLKKNYECGNVSFRYCRNMTKTPYIHINNQYIKVQIAGCSALEEFNGEYIHCLCNNEDIVRGCTFDFSTSPNINIIKIGKSDGININLQNCENLAITTESKNILENTIMQQDKIFNLTIMRSVYNRLSDSCKDFILNNRNKVVHYNIVGNE